ncbi:hypothetical protein FA048_03605 [Pedobacter polaris]|uniref:Uncharacterized protein n=1 Tax=Pedobacter polaris TaxID=2571273 RepID=A0A4U1CVK4_9SPHI|nr:hypothetical protein [Pedobacter polaris]TKC12716.1 hypothetical protein FA048_03605 [Pedobacter polaris]
MSRHITLIIFFTFFCSSLQAQNRDYKFYILKEKGDTLNYIFHKEILTIKLIGSEIDINRKNFPQLFAINGATNVRNVLISAKKITLSDTLHFPHSKIELFADSVVFASSGKSAGYLSIQPEDNPSPRAMQFKNGKQGLAAKTISLHCNKLINQLGEKAILIDVRGGNGQAAGFGENGADGKSLPVVNSKCSLHGCKVSKDQLVWVGVRDAYNRNWRLGTKDWPGDGANGIPGGKPGEGGSGGSVICNGLTIASNVMLSGGKAGAVAQSEPYKGGKGGMPRRAAWWYELGKPNVYRESQDGKDVNNPQAESIEGLSGKILSSSDPKFYITSDYLIFKVNQLRFDYQNITSDKFNQLGREINSLSDDLAKIDVIFLKNASPDDSSKVSTALNELSHYKMQLTSGLDYYNNPMNWVPALSFEVNYLNYKNEISTISQQLFLSSFIISHTTNLQNKVDAATDLVESLQLDNRNIAKNQVTLFAKIPTIKSKLANLQTETASLEAELRLIEQELAEDARDRVSEANHKIAQNKVLKTASTLLKSSPVGQPYAAAVGHVLTEVRKMNKVEQSNFLNSLSPLFQEYKDFDWESIDANWSRFENSQDANESLKLVKEISAILYKDYGKFNQKLDLTEIPQNEYEKELLALKQHSKRYLNIANRIEKIVYERMKITEEIEATLFATFSNLDQIIRNLQAVNGIRTEIAQQSDFLQYNLLKVCSDIIHDGEIRLAKFDYLMTKSYRYRILQDAPKSYDPFFYKKPMMTIIANMQSYRPMSESDYAIIRTLHEQQLLKVSEQVLTQLNYDANYKTLTKVIVIKGQDLKFLNEYGYLNLDLNNGKFFSAYEEDIRIIDVSFNNFKVKNPKNPVEFAELDLTIEHSGTSLLKKNDKDYLFRNAIGKNDRNFWGARYSFQNGQISPFQPSSFQASLIYALLGQNAQNVNLFSTPGALSKFVINKSERGIDNSVITHLTLNITYDCRTIGLSH